MWAIFRQPKWIILTLLVPVGVVLCLLAAQWQYNRHLDRRTFAHTVENSRDAAIQPFDSILAADGTLPAAAQYRPVTISGVFDSTPVFVRKRVLDGAVGYWVVNGLRTGDGQVVQVLRGWVPLGADARTNPTVPPPPSGTVTISGYAEGSQPAPAGSTADLPPGQVASLTTASLANGAASPDAFVVATAMQPADSSALRLVPMPDPSLGPHLAYSWQWLFFAAMFPVGWVIMARRDIREYRHEQGDTATAPAGAELSTNARN